MENESPPKPQQESNKFSRRSILQGFSAAGIATLFGFGTDNNKPKPELKPEPKLEPEAFAVDVAKDTNTDTETAEKTSLPFDNLMQGIECDFDTKQTLIINDEEAFKLNWAKINKDPNMPLPKIDFSQKSVILAAQGQAENGVTQITKILSGKNQETEIEVEFSRASADSKNKRPFNSFQMVEVSKILSEKAIFKENIVEGNYDVDIASSARTDKDGHTTYGAQTVTKTPITP